MTSQVDPQLDMLLSDFRYKVSESSYLSLKPGDLVQLSYNGSIRYGLIVSSRRSSTGIFLSGRNNTLINFVMIQSLSQAMISLMVNNLYKNEIACNYYSPAIIGAFLGKSNFRTLNVANTSDILQVKINE